MKVFKDDVVEALHTVYDPEIPVDVYELGLIYDVQIEDDHNVHITMTLTTPNCPVAESMPEQVREAVRDQVPGVGKVRVKLVWEPQWTQDMMSEDAKLALGLS